MAVVLYQFLECHECAFVRRLLRQANVKFEAFTMPAGEKSAVRARFGVNSVPVLQDGTFVSHELPKIAAHIRSRYG